MGEEHARVSIPRWRHGRRGESLLIRRSRASFDKMEARGGEEAQREPNGGGRGVREGSEGTVDGGGDWREKKGVRVRGNPSNS